MRKPKNKIFAFILICLFTFSCSTINNIPVKISIKDKDKVNFKDYEKIIFHHFKLILPFTDYNPKDNIQKFFSRDFSKTLNKKIEIAEIDIDYYSDQPAFLEAIKNNPESVALLGKIETKIQKRSVIKENKNDEKQKKKFVKIQHWQMDVEMILIECKSAKTIYKQNFSEKISNAHPQSIKFNFETLFYRNMDKFIQSLKEKQKIQRRYLLI